ncbi:hypothetical protein A2707_04770 [Candidatus Saccharibacteria bacterium RIFCSPHIGHO2_01_FULL_45_15]|nr:MAG: hypothetical protein A2707_04770 [Candidatus Saccharibacteria bacterium RIFCSPHIGHO2_01_FULL_45_15]OGL27722.1 MAG: hypothetical protein A3C39_03410 [Candidatus Saccharibacteria bacterium RIFCSPHIGHO2_02_FULL_46_12]OGL32716.1 MAG: hypothetical protein A3E76_05190 [Candidatus Saccharibacteria bacterium RIFCSPHIGHO2_12_FULL_44_22]
MVALRGIINSMIESIRFKEEAWMEDASCRDRDSSEFFHPDGERGNSRKRRIKAAKEICSRCVVIDQCRQYAMDNSEPYGVWGGLSEDERRIKARIIQSNIS